MNGKSSKNEISYFVNNLKGKDLHGIKTKSSSHYRLPKVKTMWGRRVSSYLFIDEWDKLNASIKLATNFDIFEQRFLTSFLDYRSIIVSDLFYLFGWRMIICS